MIGAVEVDIAKEKDAMDQTDDTGKKIYCISLCYTSLWAISSGSYFLNFQSLTNAFIILYIAAEKGVHEFWLTAMKHNEITAAERDQRTVFAYQVKEHASDICILNVMPTCSIIWYNFHTLHVQGKQCLQIGQLGLHFKKSVSISFCSIVVSSCICYQLQLD